MYFPIFSCLLFLLRTTDCFQWSQLQQSSHVVSSYLGSNVTLSCDFVLSAQEKQEMQQFHVVLWSRQTHSPAPLSWQALASITNINNVLDSSSKIIYPDQNKFSLKNNSLTVFNIGIGDDSQYQCEVKSSFYTTPSVVKLNVLYKPLDTQLFASKTVLTNKEGFELNCTAHANPKAGYSFLLDGKLVQNSTSHHYVIDKADKQYQGEYTCLPWNYYGHGPNATVDIKVEDYGQVITVIDILSPNISYAIQNKLLEVRCIANATPPPTWYSWKINKKLYSSINNTFTFNVEYAIKYLAISCTPRSNYGAVGPTEEKFLPVYDLPRLSSGLSTRYNMTTQNITLVSQVTHHQLSV